MKQLETISTLERRLTISFPSDLLKNEVQKRLQKVARTAKIQGFRPGKAPMKIVEQNYGGQIYEDVLGTEIQRQFTQAVTEDNIRVAGYPRFEPAEQNDPAQYTFKAVFEVYPDIEIQSLAGKEIEKPLLTVSDEDIDKTIETLRRQRTSYNYVERAAQKDDRVIINFKGSIDGVAFEGGSAENFPFVLGQGQMLPEFEAGVEGLKEGESREVSVTFPENYHGKDVAGKTAIFHIEVKNVSEPQLPALDDAFAKSLGMEDASVDTLKQEVRKNVELEAKRRLAARTKENVMQALLDTHKIELPKSLLMMEAQRLMEQTRQDFAQRGMDTKKMPAFPADIFLPQAERRVALGLLLNELLKKHQIEVAADDERVRQLVREYAQSYEKPEDVENWYYASPERIEGPRAMILEELLVEKVLAEAQVKEVNLTFDELMGNP